MTAVPLSPGEQGSTSLNSDLNITCNIGPFFFFSQLLLLSMPPYLMDYLCGQFGSDVSSLSPPKSLCIPSLLAGGMVWEAEKVLTQYKSCSTVTSLYYQHCFHQKSTTQPHIRAFEENELYPAYLEKEEGKGRPGRAETYHNLIWFLIILFWSGW